MLRFETFPVGPISRQLRAGVGSGAGHGRRGGSRRRGRPDPQAGGGPGLQGDGPAADPRPLRPPGRRQGAAGPLAVPGVPPPRGRLPGGDPGHADGALRHEAGPRSRPPPSLHPGDVHHGLRTLHTPGHTPGSCCFLGEFEQGPVVLAGDTLFQGGVGRTDLWGGHWDQLEASIQRELYTLEDRTLVVPGHGPITTIGEEAEKNPFVSAAPSLNRAIMGTPSRGVPCCEAFSAFFGCSGIIVFFCVVWLFSCIRIVNEYERAVIFTLGQGGRHPQGPRPDLRLPALPAGRGREPADGGAGRAQPGHHHPRQREPEGERRRLLPGAGHQAGHPAAWRTTTTPPARSPRPPCAPSWAK